ncbi:MAG: divalent-cation tolerance protein CutA [Zetaproteobacteria bacterium]|nr:divalent-cation tolerance protein CutA [Zetaproteobacteria bacterium]
MPSQTQYCVVLTTVQDERVAQAIIDALLQKKLAACVQVKTVDSHYVWQNECCHDVELQLMIKTTMACYAAVEEVIRLCHDYAVPEIIAWPITQGSAAYLAWIEECCLSKGSIDPG